MKTTAERAAEFLERAGIAGGECLRGQSIKEASRNLGYSPAKTYRLVEENRIQHVKGGAPGSAVRINWLFIADFLAENEHGNGETKPRLVAAGAAP